jgi:hypothetical protein
MTHWHEMLEMQRLFARFVIDQYQTIADSFVQNLLPEKTVFVVFHRNLFYQ